MTIRNFQEIMSQRILAEVTVVGRLGVLHARVADGGDIKHVEVSKQLSGSAKQTPMMKYGKPMDTRCSVCFSCTYFHKCANGPNEKGARALHRHR